jgi:cell division septation protein DedD
MILVRICFIFCVFSSLIGGCALLDEGAPKKTANNLIATPASYYSTSKAKYLGTKYKDNLDRIVERIVRNSKTAPLQFANNISSVGGIGFFTHSATKTPDERYLEVVLATPETFETKGEYSEKIYQLFDRYGFDLLSILSGDSDMYQDRELSGYGLNLAWRTVVAEGSGSRVIMARAIIYFPKEKVRSFLREEIKQNDLLNDAVIFGEEENGPLALVSYKPQTVRPDFRPAIREDNLTASAESKSARTPVASTAAKETAAKTAPKPEIAKKENPPSKTAEAVAVATAAKTESENKPTPLAPAKAAPAVSSASSAPAESAKKTAPVSAELPKAEERAPVVALQPVPLIPVESKPPAALVPTALPAPAAALKAPGEGPKVDPVPPVSASTQKPALEPKAEAKKSDARSAAKESKLTASETKISAKPVEDTQKIITEPQKSAPAAPALKADEKISEVKTAVAKSAPVVAPKVVAAPIAPAKLPEAAPVIKPEPAAAVAEVKRIEKPAPQVKTIPPAPVPVKPLEEIAVKPVEPMMLPAPARALPAVAAAESKSAEPAKAASAVVKAPTAIAAEKGIAQEAKAQTKPAEQPRAKSEPAVTQPLVPAPAVNSAPANAPAKEIKSAEAVKVAPEIKAPPVITARKEVADEKKPQTKAAAEAIAMAKPTPAPIAVAPAPPMPSSAKTETSPASAATNTLATPAENKSAEKSADEQLALVRKTPIEMVPENKALSRPPTHKALEGFIIQLAFQDKEKARNWAENMERRGYAVSITEAGTGGALRVRLGNFAVRDDAERQLRTFKQEGISGIIINLPQAFRPEVQSSLP